jgi:hypothetical protein
MNNTSMSFIAHQVNNPIFLKELVAEPVGIEIDVAYSNAKKVWIIAHHDYDNAEHLSLESWLVELKNSLEAVDTIKLKALWLDIKIPKFDLSEVCELMKQYIPKELAIIYDLGRPVNILKNAYHLSLKPHLRSNDGVASWITKDELGLVAEVASSLDSTGIENTVISYGEIVEIDTVTQLCQLDTANKIFKKVFVWNVEYNDEIKEFVALNNLDGQIIGNKIAKWDNDCRIKLDYFKELCEKNNMAINKGFWDQ